MKAVVKYGQEPDMVELRDVPEPEVRPGCVLLEVKAAGVCGWDIEMWQHRMANPVTVPVIQGHEFCGVIIETGDGVDGFQVGDKVVSETSAYVCGKCRWCTQGDYQLCPDRKGFGYGVDGAFAKYIVVRQEILHHIPEKLSFEEAALTEPFCVVHHALADMTDINAGDTVMIIGPGPIGLISLQMAKEFGAKKTILIGTQRSRSRMALAESQNWVDHSIYIDDADPVSKLMDLTDGVGADVVVDTAGNSSAFTTALKCVRVLGRIVKIGWGPKPFNESLDDLLRKSVTLSGTFGHNRRNWEAVLPMMASGQLNVKPLISEVMPLSKWRDAFEKVENREAVKIVLVPEE